jgi:hypothetical protein
VIWYELSVIDSNIVKDLADIPFKSFSPLLAFLSDLHKEVKYVYNHPIQERQQNFSDTNVRSGIYCWLNTINGKNM